MAATELNLRNLIEEIAEYSRRAKSQLEAGDKESALGFVRLTENAIKRLHQEVDFN